MDRLQSMRVFSKVVEQGSFVRAAEALSISNTVVTRYIVDLENHLGVRLLNRSTRRLSLTESGQVYLARVHHILPEIDDAEAVVTTNSKKPAGTLSLYSQTGFGQAQLSRLLPEYSKLYPDVALDVTLSERSVDLVEAGLDIGLFTAFQKFDTSMIARQLGLSEIILCAAPDYLEHNGALETPHDLVNHACLNFEHESLRHSWHMSGVNDGVMDIPISAKVVSNNGELLRQCALAGMGIMLRPSYTLGDDIRSGKLVRVLPEFRVAQMPVKMVYSSRRLLSAKVRTFVDFMMENFPEPEKDSWL
jgi:DNA-binding transcriptional LysR family regulator